MPDRCPVRPLAHRVLMVGDSRVAMRLKLAAGEGFRVGHGQRQSGYRFSRSQAELPERRHPGLRR